MLDKLAVLSGYDYFYAAVLAFLITYLIMRVRNFRSNVLKKDELEMDIKNADRKSIMDRCSKMFPIETMSFGGNVFKKGMIVRITTMQQKVFQGEFVGKNDMDIICIVTNKCIVAHEIRKITEMVSIDQQKDIL